MLVKITLEGSWYDMGQAEEDRQEPRPLERCYCGPMLPKELRSIMK